MRYLVVLCWISIAIALPVLDIAVSDRVPETRSLLEKPISISFSELYQVRSFQPLSLRLIAKLFSDKFQLTTMNTLSSGSMAWPCNLIDLLRLH